MIDDKTIDELLTRADRHGYDVRSTYHSLILTGDLAAAIRELRTEQCRIRDAEDVLHNHGFVRCDIPACNCGSWHPRYGLQERWEEIRDALADAGHPQTNANGNKLLNALRELIAERDQWREANRRTILAGDFLSADNKVLRTEIAALKETKLEEDAK